MTSIQSPRSAVISSQGEGPAPTVSVCIPTHNRAHYLPGAIDSVLAQSFRDFEICVSDNGSTDRTPEAVAAFDDPRLRYTRLPRHVELHQSFKAVFRQARGRYLAFLADDDRWEPGYLERMIAALEAEPIAVMAFCDHWVMDEESVRDLEKSDAYSRTSGRSELAEGLHRPFTWISFGAQSMVASATVFHTAELLSVLEEGARLVIDFHFFGSLALSGRGAVYVPDRLVETRVHPSSIASRRWTEVWADMEWCCADLHRLARNRPDRRLVRRKWGETIWDRGATLTRDTSSWHAARVVLAILLRLPPNAFPFVVAGAVRLGLRRARARLRPGL